MVTVAAAYSLPKFLQAHKALGLGKQTGINGTN